MSGFQTIRIFLLKDMLLTRVMRTQFTMQLVILMEKKLLSVFMEKNFKRLIKKNLELKKYGKQKETNYMSNGKDITTHLISGLVKRIF